MSCPTNEPNVDFSVLCTPKIDENIRNPLIFLRKMAVCSYHMNRNDYDRKLFDAFGHNHLDILY